MCKNVGEISEEFLSVSPSSPSQLTCKNVGEISGEFPSVSPSSPSPGFTHQSPAPTPSPLPVLPKPLMSVHGAATKHLKLLFALVAN